MWSNSVSTRGVVVPGNEHPQIPTGSRSSHITSDHEYLALPPFTGRTGDREASQGMSSSKFYKPVIVYHKRSFAWPRGILHHSFLTLQLIPYVIILCTYFAMGKNKGDGLLSCFSCGSMCWDFGQTMARYMRDLASISFPCAAVKDEEGSHVYEVLVRSDS